MSIEKLKRETFLKMVNSGEIAHNSDNEEWVNTLIQIGADFIKKEYEEKLRWIPVTEDLPDRDNYTQCLWKNEKGEIWYGMARESQKPTHWKHCFL